MSPANTYDPLKVQAQRAIQSGLAKREGRNRDHGALAGQLVREWSPEQRARIKLALLRYQALFGTEGELEVVKLIDQINEEEQWRRRARTVTRRSRSAVAVSVTATSTPRRPRLSSFTGAGMAAASMVCPTACATAAGSQRSQSLRGGDLMNGGGSGGNCEGLAGFGSGMTV